MLKAEEAQQIVLRLCNQGKETNGENEFVIQSCTLSPRRDYWVIRSNSADYVIRGMEERCYVGVSANLVNALTGEVETVSNAQGWQSYLEDKYDLINAQGNFYILRPAFDKSDKSALINLRQKLECRAQDVICMTSPNSNFWLTGNLRKLNDAKILLEKANIQVNIELHTDSQDAIEVDESVWFFDEVKALLRRRISEMQKII
ncbi:hypothetical protein [Undibacterium sp. TC9W]|uniref:hypothetical protein n=1 Tax=Undibacterium sp. TC9W TaxID=3413053 RepID=UPI003BF26119